MIASSVGAARRSTIAAAIVFVVAFSSYIAFRPDPTPSRQRSPIETTTVTAARGSG